MKTRCYSCLLLLMSIPYLLQAGNYSKIHQQINAGEYLEAREALNKCFPKDSASYLYNYEMARWYFMGDNPQFSDDTAHAYLQVAIANMPKDSLDKTYRKNLGLGARTYVLQDLNYQINRYAFEQAKTKNTVEAYKHFLDYYSNQSMLQQAKQLRNELAFNHAKEHMDFNSFKEFMEKYPDAEQSGEARAMYERLLYEKTTADGKWESYKRYIDQNPKGPYLATAQHLYDSLFYEFVVNKSNDAELYQFIAAHPNHPYAARASDSLLHREINSGEVEELLEFKRKYPAVRNMEYVWNLIYLQATAEGGASYSNFAQAHPDFPYPNKLQADHMLDSLPAVIFEQDGKWGYKEQKTDQVLCPPKFAEAQLFSGRLAAVADTNCKNGKCLYGFIDKHFQWVIPARYAEVEDFHQGFAVVGKGDCPDSNCKYGAINELGREVLPCIYDDVDDFSDGYFLVEKEEEGLYFLNAVGKSLFTHPYPKAHAFREHIAMLSNDSLWYYINTQGKPINTEKYLLATDFSEGLAVVSKNGNLFGYIDSKGQWFKEAQFKEAAPMKNGVARVVKEETIKKKRKSIVELHEYLLHADGTLSKLL